MSRNVIPLAALLLTSVSMSAFAQQVNINWDSQSYQKIGDALRNSAIPEPDINPVINVLLNQIRTTGIHDQHDSLIRIRTTATEINSSCAHMVGTITPLRGSGQIDIDLTICNRTPGGLRIDSGGITGPRLVYAPTPAPVQLAQAAPEQPRPPRHQHAAQQPVSAPPSEPTPTATASGDITQMSVADAMKAMGGRAPPPEHLATPHNHQSAAPAPAPTPPTPVVRPAAAAPVAAVAAVAVAPPAPAPIVTPAAATASSPPSAPTPAQASTLSAADRARFVSEVEQNHRVPAEIAEADVDVIAQAAFTGIAPQPKAGPKNSRLEITRVGYIMSRNESTHNWMQFTWTRTMPVENGPAHFVKVSGQMTYIVRTDGRTELSWSLDPGYLQFQIEHTAEMAAEAAARQAAIDAERQRQEAGRQAEIAAQQAAAEAQRKAAEAAAEAERKRQEEAAAAALAAKFATIGRPTAPPSPQPAPTADAPTSPPPPTDQATPPAPPPPDAPPPPPRHKVISDL